MSDLLCQIKNKNKSFQSVALDSFLLKSMKILPLGYADMTSWLLTQSDLNPNLRLFKNKLLLPIQSHAEVKKPFVSLHQELMSQLACFPLDLNQKKALQWVIQYVENDGLIKTDPAEMALAHDLEIKDVCEVIWAIQQCDPAGVGAFSVPQSLLLQLDRLQAVPPLVKTLLKKHWQRLSKGNLGAIANAEQVDVLKIKEAIAFLKRHVDPKPTRQFGDQIIRGSSLFEIKVIQNKNHSWYCQVDEKLDQFFPVHRQNLEDPGVNQIVQMLHFRKKTIKAVMDAVLLLQQGFFESQGRFSALQKMTLKDLSAWTGFHESTVARALSEKRVLAPFGCFETHLFFQSGIRHKNGMVCSSPLIKKWIADMIAQESSENPLSDAEISEQIFQQNKIVVSRRAIAKYRDGLGILTSFRRKSHF